MQLWQQFGEPVSAVISAVGSKSGPLVPSMQIWIQQRSRVCPDGRASTTPECLCMPLASKTYPLVHRLYSRFLLHRIRTQCKHQAVLTTETFVDSDKTFAVGKDWFINEWPFVVNVREHLHIFAYFLYYIYVCIYCMHEVVRNLAAFHKKKK